MLQQLAVEPFFWQIFYFIRNVVRTEIYLKTAESIVRALKNKRMVNMCFALSWDWKHRAWFMGRNILGKTGNPNILNIFIVEKSFVNLVEARSDLF